MREHILVEPEGHPAEQQEPVPDVAVRRDASKVRRQRDDHNLAVADAKPEEPGPVEENVVHAQWDDV